MIRAYARFASRHPFALLALCIFVSYLAYLQLSGVELEATAFEKMFPEDIEVIRGFKIAEDQFFGSQNMFVVVFIDPELYSEHSVRDIRQPEVARYIKLIQEKLEGVKGVSGSRSYVDYVGELPGTLDEIRLRIQENPVAEAYISGDRATALIKLQVSDVSGREESFVRDVERAIDSIAPPPGVRAVVAGDPVNGKIFKELTARDMQATARFSFLGILFFTALVLWSLRYSFLPLASVTLGTFWSFGMIGALGIKISSTLAGVVSMIMGIGIDFAIQIIGRYMQEVQGYFGRALSPEEAMRVTLENVVKPMAITTIAALIGFRAMALGELRFMHDLANVMSIGVLACMLSALTFVPSAVLILNKLKEVRM